MANRRRICFVTGTRAEFGLMTTVLRAIADHPQLQLQLIATGMHLDPAHGDGLAMIRSQGWGVDATVPWPAGSGANLTAHAANTGAAMAGLASAFERLKCDIVLVVGDRVEAFAAAAAAHIGGRVVAHVHAGDRAAGQVDDALRHAISKLAHIHFPATRMSAQRLLTMGEDRWRIHRVGTPGVDGIRASAAPWKKVTSAFPSLQRKKYALVIYHPVDSETVIEASRTRAVLDAVSSRYERAVVIHPNNDPGSGGIRRVLDECSGDERYMIRRDVERDLFLGLMRDAAVLVGNSSSGIIEAASFGTPVLDIGPRQAGRECSANVRHVNYGKVAIDRALGSLSKLPRPRAANVYGGGGAGRRIARLLASIKITPAVARKLIAY